MMSYISCRDSGLALPFQAGGVVSGRGCGSTDLMRIGTQEMSGILEVKGEATLASVSERDMPACADFSACVRRQGRGGRGEEAGERRQGRGGRGEEAGERRQGRG